MAHCLWAIHKLCCLSTLACYNFTLLPTLPAWSIPTNTPTKTVGAKQWPANRWCRIRTNCIIAAVRMKILPDHKEGHLGPLTKVLGTLGQLFKKRTTPGKTGRIGTIVYLHIPRNLCTLLSLWCNSKSMSRPILGVKVTPVICSYVWRDAVFVFYRWLIYRKIDTMVTDCSSWKIKYYNKCSIIHKCLHCKMCRKFIF